VRLRWCFVRGVEVSSGVFVPALKLKVTALPQGKVESNWR